MRTGGRAACVAVVVVLAGCQLPAGDEATPTDTVSPTAPVTPTTTPTPTTRPPDPYPPGVDEADVENVTALVEGHVSTLNRTGFVAVGRGSTAILRNGFLVGVTVRTRTVAVAGGSRYREVRNIDAGVFTRVVERYGNATVERVRRTENGDVTYRRRSPQNVSALARAELLRNVLEGGAFDVTDVREANDSAVVTLHANRSDNDTAVLATLPEKAQRVRSFQATVVVERSGRVRALNATIGFVIAGRNRTHRVSYDVRRLGVANVSEPGWLENASAPAAP